MSGSAGPLLVVPLRDGTEARLTATTLVLGAKEYSVARISVARQVSPDPVTVALLVAGAGMVEFQPARPEDGPIVLEALFRLRPDLRPPGFESPAGMPAIAFLPGNMLPGQVVGRVGGSVPGDPGYAAPPGAGATLSGINPQPLPRQYHASYGPPTAYTGRSAPVPAMAQPVNGSLGPYPRGAFTLYGAALVIYVLRLLRWLALGLLVALIPAALGAASTLLLEYAFGLDPLQATDLQTRGDGSLVFLQGGHTIAFGADTSRLLIYGLVALGVYLLSHVLAVFQLAVLAAATRDALLGRAPRLGASLASGLRRFFPVLGASILVGLVMLVFGMLVVGCTVVSNVGLADAATASGSASMSPLVIAGMVGGILLVPILFIGIYLWGRVLLAPFAAATERLGPRAAFARSWRLTRRNWWHTVVPVVLTQFTMMCVVLVFSDVAFAGELGTQAVSVFMTALVAPLGAIVATSVLFDLRLRTEGYKVTVSESQPPADSPVAAAAHPPAQPR